MSYLFVCAGTGGVAITIRIVHRPIFFLTRHCATRLEWLFLRKELFMTKCSASFY